MSVVLGTSMLGMRNYLTPGMQQRAAIRSFAKAHGTLTQSGQNLLNALDRFDREQLIAKEIQKKNDAAKKKANRDGNAINAFSKVGSSAVNARHSSTMAGAYESQALSYASQARAAAAAGDEEQARTLQSKALQAADNANKMHAKEAELERKEAEERKAKIEKEAKDRIEQRKAEEKAREALEAARKRRELEAEAKAREAKNHLQEAHKAKLERQKAEIEVWGKRVQEGQFWIHQMQLVQEGKHPSQAWAQAQVQAFRDASVAVATVAPDYTPVVTTA